MPTAKALDGDGNQNILFIPDEEVSSRKRCVSTGTTRVRSCESTSGDGDDFDGRRGSEVAMRERV